MTKEELEINQILDYVSIEELLFIGDTLKFYLTYNVEGAVAEGKFVKTGAKWKIIEYVVSER